MAIHPHFLWKDLFRRSKSDEHSIPECLKNNILFKNLNARELNYLSSLVYQRIYQTNEVIFRQNERGFGMYLIIKGNVSVRTLTSEGETQVTTLGEGSFFGELALVESDNIRTASVVATERTLMIGFFKPDLLDLLESKPEMGVKILFQLSSVLARRLIETTDKITQLKNLQKEMAHYGSTNR
jgi:CRP-like cAMP-binding protein